MASRQGVFSSSVGTKLLIGITGVLLFLYLLIHIAGNLVVFLGPAAFNKYAHTLESNPLLPAIELVLLSWFVVHIYKTVRMFLSNQSARPVAYAKKKSAGHTTRKTFASSTMIVSGLWLLVFLLIHVKAFHDGWGTEYEWPAGGRDLYRQEMETFQNPLMVALLRHQHAGGRLAPVARHLERLPVAGRRQAGVDPLHPAGRQGHRRAHRRRLHRHRPLGPLYRSPVMKLDAKVPDGPIEKKWDLHKFQMKLVNPANKRKYTIIVVGTGLAGASAASSLGELGYNVLNFCIQDSPRRAHSIAAQGGINAAKNYQNDGDSVYRLFYDTVKGGDYRSREANVYRLAQLSVNIIDQCVAQGVPFAREYGGLLDNRSFGGAQVSRTFYARGQTGQQLLIGAYQSLMRQVHEKAVKLFARREMLDLVVVDGKARGIIVRNLVTGEIERYAGRRGHSRHRRLRHRLLPVDQRGELATSPRRGARTSAAPTSRTPASRRFTRPAFRSAASTSRS